MPNFPQVKSLLLKKASVNEEINNYGDTALHYCAYLGYADMVQWLLEHQADPNIRNKDGATPLSLAQMANQSDVLALLQGAKKASPVSAPANSIQMETRGDSNFPFWSAYLDAMCTCIPPAVCPVCGVQNTEIRGIYRHSVTAHGVDLEKEVVCHICMCVYRNAKRLVWHHRTEHMGTKTVEVGEDGVERKKRKREWEEFVKFEETYPPRPKSLSASTPPPSLDPQSRSLCFQPLRESEKERIKAHHEVFVSSYNALRKFSSKLTIAVIVWEFYKREVSARGR